MIIIAILIIVVLIIIYLYNKLIRLNLKCDNSWSNIDVLLKKRVELIPNLVEITKGYSKHESETLIKTINARNNTVNQISKNSEEITNSLNKLFLLQEKYPDLKADTTFRNLQIELVNIEEKLASERIIYNDSITRYNTSIESFPTNIVAKFMNYKKRYLFNIKDEDKEIVKIEL